MSSSEVGDYLTKPEAARLLNVAVRTFDDFRAKGIVGPPLMLGPRSLRWKRSELIAAMDAMPRGRGTTVGLQATAAPAPQTAEV